jgi:hypothetical protein
LSELALSADPFLVASLGPFDFEFSSVNLDYLLRWQRGLLSQHISLVKEVIQVFQEGIGAR